MRRLFFQLLLAAFALTSVANSAQARGKLTTKYKYYSVSGSSAAALHRNMTVPSGFFSSEKVYANITMKPTFKGTFKQGKRCRLKNFGINGQFVIRLPKLSRGTKLPARLNRNFKSFVAYVRKHELRHRTIWTRCLRSAESRILRLKYKSCDRLDQQAAKIIKAEWAKCAKQNSRFDRLEAKRLLRLPLVRSALSKPRPGKKSRRAASKKQLTSTSAGYKTLGVENR